MHEEDSTRLPRDSSATHTSPDTSSKPDCSREVPPHRLHPWSRDKVVALEAALDAVRDGCLLALGGFTLYRRPVRAVLALAQRGIRNLTLIDYIAGFEADLLIGAGCVSTIRSCFCGMEILGFAPNYRRALADGALVAVPETEATLAYGLRAARARTDFIPARIYGGTQMLELRPDLKLVNSPYSDSIYVAVPAIHPDVAIIHALMADDAGNAVLASELALDADLAAASRHTVITAERIVPTSEIERHGADVLGAWVDAVVEMPRGAWPTSCLPDYAHDMIFLADYVEACASDGFSEFLDRMQARHPI
jgi:glutaconate CoA-transferase subunit A